MENPLALCLHFDYGVHCESAERLKEKSIDYWYGKVFGSRLDNICFIFGRLRGHLKNLNQKSLTRTAIEGRDEDRMVHTWSVICWQFTRQVSSCLHKRRLSFSCWAWRWHCFQSSPDWVGSATNCRCIYGHVYDNVLGLFKLIDFLSVWQIVGPICFMDRVLVSNRNRDLLGNR